MVQLQTSFVLTLFPVAFFPDVAAVAAFFPCPPLTTYRG